MAFIYSGIATYFGIANWSSSGTLGGVYNSPASKTWDIFLGLGSYAFAFAYTMLLPEVQDTVAEPTIKRTTRAVHISVPLMTALYLLVCITCYGALGNTVAPYVLDSFSSPVALIVVANMAVCIHLIPAYAVYAQPTFALVEEHAARIANGRLDGKWAARFFRLIWRSFYVLIIAFIAALLPWFGDAISLVGATGVRRCEKSCGAFIRLFSQFWPLTVYYPVKMYILIKKPGTLERCMLRLLDLFCFLITVCATIGSVVAIVEDVGQYHLGLF